MVVIDLGEVVSPVSIADVKAWARIDRADEDDTLRLLVKAASETIERDLGIALSRRQFRLIASERTAGGMLRGNRLPIVSVDEVLAYDRRGEEFRFDAQTCARLSVDRDAVHVGEAVWSVGANGVEAVVTCGLDTTEVPAEMRQAVLVAAATWFEARASIELGHLQVLPEASRRLLAGRRRVRI